MRRVFGIGETVLDIIFKDDKPVTSTAGGSALNTCVSLARMDVDVFFITEIGNDKVGDIIVRFLETNHLSPQYICRFSQGQTALALAFLDDNNDASYDFYKHYPSQRLQGVIPDFTSDDLVVFGSYFGLNPQIRPQLLRYLSKAKQAGSIIIYDPNFRKHHLANQAQLLSVIEENFSLATIVRGSDEDFFNICGLKDPFQVYERVKPFCTNLVITANANEVLVFSANEVYHYPVPTLQPVSTIGAGDNFNAGLVYGLIETNIHKQTLSKLSKTSWDVLVNYGICFSAEVCSQLENYLPIDFKNRINTSL